MFPSDSVASSSSNFLGGCCSPGEVGNGRGFRWFGWSWYAFDVVVVVLLPKRKKLMHHSFDEKQIHTCPLSEKSSIKRKTKLSQFLIIFIGS